MAEWSPRKGAKVKLLNILGRKHLNGSIGVVLDCADSSLVERESRRCRVKLEECGTTVMVLPENLEPYAPGPGLARASALKAARVKPLTEGVELPGHVTLRTEAPAKAPAEMRDQLPRRAQSVNLRVVASRREQPCGEVYAAVQRSRAGRDPLRLRHLGDSFFREKPGDGHPKGCSSLPRRFPEAALSARDWRREGAQRDRRYVSPDKIPMERGGQGAPVRRPPNSGGPAAQTAVEGLDTFELHPVLKGRLFEGSSCAWSRLRSGLDPSIPLDAQLQKLIPREDTLEAMRVAAAGKAPVGSTLGMVSEPGAGLSPLGRLSPRRLDGSDGSVDGALSDPGFLGLRTADDDGFDLSEVERMLGATPDFLRPASALAGGGNSEPAPRVSGVDGRGGADSPLFLGKGWGSLSDGAADEPPLRASQNLRASELTLVTDWSLPPAGHAQVGASDLGSLAEEPLPPAGPLQAGASDLGSLVDEPSGQVGRPRGRASSLASLIDDPPTQAGPVSAPATSMGPVADQTLPPVGQPRVRANSLGSLVDEPPVHSGVAQAPASDSRPPAGETVPLAGRTRGSASSFGSLVDDPPLPVGQAQGRPSDLGSLANGAEEVASSVLHAASRNVSSSANSGSFEEDY